MIKTINGKIDGMHIFSKIDNFLNSITMYRLVMHGLLALAFISILLSVFGFIYYSFTSLLFSLFILLGVCYGTNRLFAKIFKAPTNLESPFISGLILFFIMAPAQSFNDVKFLVIAGTLAMLSKYVLAYHSKHIFNPVAISALIIGILGSGNVIWWVANKPLFPFVLILSLLVVRKLKRFSLFLSFFITAFSILFLNQYLENSASIKEIIALVLISWPIIFFAGIMLTEPLTTPPKKETRIAYGIIVGILFSIHFNFGIIYSTPELALVVGNIFAYIFSFKNRLYLSLLEKKEIAKNIFEFSFKPNRKFKFQAGQYLEFTLDHDKPDQRGERRYFTIASSPTEENIKIGIKYTPEGSTFKKNLLALNIKNTIVAGGLNGNFVLPEANDGKMVFIAGGIGVTPFRSMVQYMNDLEDKREVVLFYNVKSEEEIAYRDIFEQAKKKLNLKVIYVLSSSEENKNWQGEVGLINKEMLFRYIDKDVSEYDFYLSGPNAMVSNYKKLIEQMGVQNNKIHTDYFPGY